MHMGPHYSSRRLRRYGRPALCTVQLPDAAVLCIQCNMALQPGWLAKVAHEHVSMPLRVLLCVVQVGLRLTAIGVLQQIDAASPQRRRRWQSSAARCISLMHQLQWDDLCWAATSRELALQFRTETTLHLIRTARDGRTRWRWPLHG